ncbi:MAG TPA: Flp pilus assembly protein CpaB [Candidatus Omnitrophota bacterium]|nr:Flp pilus assembly protein CpaB [Candidatus Omnitrophota bacterium]HSA30203.1 Flp pilus assembly protein CpaB [Candidatus Omnitrophota bacterium]
MNLENKKQIAIILLAVGLGLVASVLTAQFVDTKIAEQRKALSEEITQTKVGPLVRQIQELEKQMVDMAEEQKRLAAIRVAQPAPTAEGGAPVEGALIAEKAVSKSTLALMTPSGKRAFTVMIDSLSAVGGMISPGDFVDIIVDVKMPDPTEGGTKDVSSIIFQNIQVLAVDTNLKASGQYEQQSKARSLNLTFALTPEEAGLMSFLQKHGQMQLLLRAPAEDEIELVEVASWRSLADYVAEKQGTELVIPRTKAIIEPISTKTTEEVKPFIEIFEGGRAK